MALFWDTMDTMDTMVKSVTDYDYSFDDFAHLSGEMEEWQNSSVFMPYLMRDEIGEFHRFSPNIRFIGIWGIFAAIVIV